MMSGEGMFCIQTSGKSIICTTKIDQKATHVWSFYYFLRVSLASWFFCIVILFIVGESYVALCNFFSHYFVESFLFSHFRERNAAADKVSVVNSSLCLVLMRVADYVPVVYKTLDCLVSPHLFVCLVVRHYSFFCLGTFLWSHFSCFNFSVLILNIWNHILTPFFWSNFHPLILLFFFFRLPCLIISVYVVTKTERIFSLLFLT